MLSFQSRQVLSSKKTTSIWSRHYSLLRTSSCLVWASSCTLYRITYSLIRPGLSGSYLTPNFSFHSWNSLSLFSCSVSSRSSTILPHWSRNLSRLGSSGCMREAAGWGVCIVWKVIFGDGAWMVWIAMLGWSAGRLITLCCTVCPMTKSGDARRRKPKSPESSSLIFHASNILEPSKSLPWRTRLILRCVRRTSLKRPEGMPPLLNALSIWL